jgi:hypothetical protein
MASTAEDLRRAQASDPDDRNATPEQNRRCRRCECRYITHGPKGCKNVRCSRKCKAFCK